MEILFIGGIFSDNVESEIITKTKTGAVQYAAKKFQSSLIESIASINNCKLSVLSAPFVGTFPKEYKDIYYKADFCETKNDIDYRYVSFLNIWGIRNYFRAFSLKKNIEEQLAKTNETKVIFVYSPHLPFLQAAVYAKRKKPDIKICMIVPDLPQYMNLNEKKSILYSVMKKVDIKKITQLYNDVDSFVLITEGMKSMVNISDKPSAVIEGIIDKKWANEINNHSQQATDGIRTIVYTGTLNKKFGVIKLVEAFCMLKDSNLRLKICGSGDASNEIRELAKKDNRIVYLGQLSNKDAIKLQLESTLLVNPRPSNEEYTKYSFPYKTMEYLLTGKPVITFKLEGIPNEYNNHLFYFDNYDAESMKSKLSEVLNLPEDERNAFGKRAQQFVLKNKSTEATGKIIENLITQMMK